MRRLKSYSIKPQLFVFISVVFITFFTLSLLILATSLKLLVILLLTAGYLVAVLFFLMYLFRADWKFFKRNFIDLLEAFLPLQYQHEKQNNSLTILIFNWRDIKHTFAGGAEVYVHEIAKRWVKKGHKVILFCGNDGKHARHEIYDGVEVIRRGGFYFVYVWAFVYYMLKLRKQTDIIIDAQNGIPFFTPLYARKPIFCLMHHVHQEYLRTSLTHPLYLLAYFLEQKVMPLVYRNVKFMTVSNSTKQDMEKLRLGKAGIDIVYPGVDINNLKPGTKAQNPMILYLGRLKSYKSIDVFIKSAPVILKQFPHATFVIAGFGEEERKLKKLTKTLGVFDKFSFQGKVSEEEKIRLYQKAWVFVNPSLLEGWGITTIEANACGTPVVASNVPGLRDSVKNPHTGFLVKYGNEQDFAEKVTLLLGNPSMLHAMSAEAITWAENFDWEKSAEKSLQIIQTATTGVTTKENSISINPVAVTAETVS